MRVALVAIALYALPATTHAQIMKCIGPGGRVEFASSCPPGTKAENTGIRNVPSAAPSSPQKSVTERDSEFRKRLADQQEAAKKAEEQTRETADRKQNCEAARSYLLGLQSGSRIAKTDPKTGERVFLEDSEREAEVARAQRAVDSNCK
jgi:hypothetical protein